ncbi:hypothetical protein CANCADRAFT_17434, partial [Tortispora caseinolytica NRRL Y-17796]
SQRLILIEQDISKTVEDEYQDDILLHMKDLEKFCRPDSQLMDLQPEIEWHMRPYLIDFLIELHLSLRLKPKTLFLAISLIDRYCSKRVVYKKHYQLVGCVAIWIAAKYEDKKERVPSVQELKQMCCHAYEESMFVQMEGHVLTTLDWVVGQPTCECYLQVLRGRNYNPLVENMARYFCEITLFSRPFLTYTSSVIASSAHLLALHILGHINLGMHESLTKDEVNCVMLICDYIQSPSRTLAKKYSSQATHEIAYLVSEFVARQQAVIAARLEAPSTPPPALSS